MPALPSNISAILPIVIVVWLGFFVCLGFWLSTRMVRSTFQRRMQQALTFTEEEVEDIAGEQRDEEMRKSLIHRVLAPVLQKMGRKMKAKASGAAGQQIRDMLEQAGHPLGMYYAEFMGFKLLVLLFTLALGFISSFFAVPPILRFMEAAGDPTLYQMGIGLWTIIFAFLGFSGPTFWLRRTVNIRVKQIRKAMADVVDLIVLSLEAGLAFDMAVGQAVEKTKGPLTDELRRVLEEIRVGKPQSDAFRDMAARVKMPDMSLLVASIDQASITGVGMAYALRLQANEIRERRMAYIKEQAGKLPVKMMLPLVLFIFPALFVVILGPAAVQMVEMSNAGMLPAG